MSFYLGAYWGPRRETAEDCGNRLARCLDTLASHSASIADWYREAEGTSRPSAKAENWEQIPLAGRDLANLLREGRDEDEALGFSAGLWNLKTGPQSAGVSVHAGSSSEHAPPNNFLLNMPAPDAAPELYLPDTATAMIRAVIECWDPDWATWTSHDLVDRQDEHVSGSIDWDALQPGDEIPSGVAKALGFATYLTNVGEPAGPVPDGARVQKLNTGILVTIGENPARVPAELLLAVREWIGENSLA